MTDAAVLARLMRQAEAAGVELVTLQALVEEASQAGAERALGALGLGDPAARRDMDELRQLLRAWRDAKRTAWKTAVDWIVRLGLALLVIGMALETGVMEKLGG